MTIITPIFFLCAILPAFGNGKILLQKHQKYAVDYLLKHKNQKGLLINHSLGSGKTYLSIAYCEKFQNKQVYVILPRFLKSNWITQLQSYGVRNTNRYHLLSFRESQQILTSNLKNSIVIIDEVHKIIDGIRFGHSSVSQSFSDIYQKISEAEKILALTGTPIYNDVTDLAYIGNLIRGSHDFPLNPGRFKTEYTTIIPYKSLIRGYLMESKTFMSYLPTWGSFSILILIGATAPHVALLAALGINIAIPSFNAEYPANKVQFREFSPEKLKDFATKYISFYEIPLKNSSEYPDKDVSVVNTEYNRAQLNFFMSFADEDLKPEELKMLLRSYPEKYNDTYIELNSSAIQKRFISETGAGRDIGNLSIRDEKGKVYYAKKFYDILDIMKAKEGQVAIYSNYFENGILEFAKFLDHHGYKDNYIVLTPEDSIDLQIKKLAMYNTKKKRIILIHPEITEGVSLLATEQFHILEPVKNSALMDQIIGRAVRYQSHKSLPKERQFVQVYIWQIKMNYSSFFPNEASAIRRKHWQKRFAEVNPNLWTKGITELDHNYFRKDDSPDTLTLENNDFVKRDSDSFKDFVRRFSIESRTL